jgi:hypothetical protein
MEATTASDGLTRRATTNAQRGAAIAGICLAVASVPITFGASIVAMVAIWIAWAVARRRKQPLTRGVSWLWGAGAVGTLVIAVAAFGVTQMPKGAFREMKRAMDSASAGPQPPPPEWLRKITPPSAQRQSALTESMIRSSAFTTWTLVIGAGLLVALVSAYAGTLGWMSSMLLVYAATGAWLAPGATDPSLLSAPPADPLRSRRGGTPGPGRVP